MNLTKTALIASTMLALSTQVFATETIHSTRVITTADVATKAAAYELAVDKLDTLQTDSSAQLNSDLGHIAPDSRSLVLNEDGYITVMEKMNEKGELLYTGLVNVNISYDMAD